MSNEDTALNERAPTAAELRVLFDTISEELYPFVVWIDGVRPATEQIKFATSVTEACERYAEEERPPLEQPVRLRVAVNEVVLTVDVERHVEVTHACRLVV